MQFLSQSTMPDTKTVWLFHEQMTGAELKGT